jgi:malonyl CoA-acyl carrier protein transacylase/acyl carrier protein
VLQGAGAPVSIVAGHSAGEIAALVAAGSLTVAEGAEILVHRSAVLADLITQPGGMLMLGCSADRARDVLAAVGHPMVALAVRNAPRQTVVSGPSEVLDTVARVAALLGITATLLTVAYPFHSPMLAGAVPEFAARIRHLEPRPPRTLVFSPILGRFHRPEDDLREHIAGALVAPVAFDRALDRLRDAGVRVFVECATGGTLGRLVRACLPEATVDSAGDLANPAVPPASPRPPAPLAAALPPLRELAPSVPAAPTPPAAAPAPIAAPPVAPVGREALFADIVDMYAEALEYPAEVFTEDVKLEEDLGIDSVKQTELMARAADRYGLPQPPLDFRLGDYDTMGKLVDYVSAAGGRSAARPLAAQGIG